MNFAACIVQGDLTDDLAVDQWDERWVNRHVDVDAKSKIGDTALLILASKGGYFEVVRELLKWIGGDTVNA